MNRLSREIYEGIQEELSEILSRYDIDEYKKSFVSKVEICYKYFKNSYEYEEEIEISKTCIEYLKDVLEDSVFVLQLLDLVDEKVKFTLD